MVLTFESAAALLGKRTTKKLENNTYLERVDENTFGVKLHQTYVVRIRRDGNYQLNTGGWRTTTTKDRINNYSPARVHQAKHVWYLGDKPFEDSIIVNSAGNPV